ncbi:MAG TPA: anti-sigma factor, partial [Sphingomicrobium sp.]|nr:anti-sigma factor [Sphingomicrobium sp.]
MEHSEDHIAIAAEYALGTLDADERAQVETMMAVDTEFTAMVQSWEFRLGVLNQMVGSVEPRPELWERVRAAVGHSSQQAPLVLPEAPPSQTQAFEPIAPTPTFDPVAPTGPIAPLPDNSSVIRLSSRAKRWRGVASVMTAIAAVLVAVVGVQLFSPDMLPAGLRPKPRTQVVEVKTPAPPAAPSAQYVALLQGSAGGPAFILTVDGATKKFTVRKVGAPPVESGKSYELWLISDKLGGRPRSLGVIGNNDFTARTVLTGFDSDVINGGVYAVTVEQAGGSP